MNSIKKSALVLAVVLLASAMGFGIAKGYGGHAGGGHNGLVKATVTVSAPAGQVLGASTFVFTKDLWQTMTNNDVIELQARLRAEGFFSYATNTGYFGPITFAGVKAYQLAHQIPSTGYVGPLTRASLNASAGQ